MPLRILDWAGNSIQEFRLDSIFKFCEGVAISADNSTVAVKGWTRFERKVDGRGEVPEQCHVCLLDIRNGSVIAKSKRPCDSDTPMAFHPQESIFVWQFEKNICILDYLTGKTTRLINKRYYDSMKQLQFTKVGKQESLFVLGSSMCHYHLRSGYPMKPLPLPDHKGFIRSFSVSENGQFLATYQSSRIINHSHSGSLYKATISILDLRRNELVHEIKMI